MNKYQETLNNVKKVYVESDHYDEEDIRLLQELVDKATPKKVLNTKLHHIDAIMKKYKCPQCSMYSFDFRYSKPKFCNNCGQALDWSDEDDK